MKEKCHFDEYFSLHRTLISAPGTFGKDFIEDSLQLKGLRFLSKSGITHPNWDLWAEKWRSLKKTRMLPRVRGEHCLAQTALPPNHRCFFFYGSVHPFSPCMVLKSPFEIRPKPIAATGWGANPSTVHVDTAVWDLSSCYCRPTRCTMCCFEITRFTCIDLVILKKTPSHFEKAKNLCVAHLKATVLQNPARQWFHLKGKQCNVGTATATAYKTCHWHPVEMSFCVCRSRLTHAEPHIPVTTVQQWRAKPFCSRSLSFVPYGVKISSFTP